MANELPPQLRDQLAQLQNVQSQLQMTLQQRQQIDFQLKEQARAVEELGTVAEETPVYRNVGSLLIKTDGPAAVKKRLEDESETLQIRLKGLEKQEGRLKEKASELQSKVQAAVKNLGLGSTESGNSN